MPHHTPLLATIVAGLVLAFVLGALAHRLRVSPLIGYLLAGVAVGPFTPGYVADQSLANELAELGVILLMFGVGLHFSLRDLLAVRKIAVPGAIGQIAFAVALGMSLATMLGWTAGEGFVFGLALSVASTVVLLRALEERRIVDTDRGRIAVGWLIVEDLVMVFALVLLPALAQSGASVAAAGLAVLATIGKVAAFAAVMLIAGRRLVPWLLHEVAHSGSRELFRLAVLAIALGVAFGAAKLFGVSFALGAFFAGMILAESPLSQRAAEDTLPLRDAFAVLFFVSVGMLFNPAILVEAPLPLLATVLIIVAGKSIAAYLIVRAFGRSARTGLTIAASLAQIGEFSFILVSLGASLELLPAQARDMILAGAIISIMLNPLVFRLSDRLAGGQAAEAPERVIAGAAEAARGHVVLVGHGRLGRRIAKALIDADEQVVVIESADDAADLPDHASAVVIVGNAAGPETLARADLARARLLIVAIPPGYEAGQIVEQARAANPALRIVARAEAQEEAAYLTARGADQCIVGEEEVAHRMVAFASP